MNEEVKEEVASDSENDSDNENEVVEDNKTDHHSAVEVSAREQGWVPEDEWQGEADKWRPAKEFVDRGELFDKINSQKRAMDNMHKEISGFKDTTKKMGEYLKGIDEKAYKRAVKSLKKEQAAAVELGDSEKVREITDEIEQTTVDFHSSEKENKIEKSPSDTPDLTAEQQAAFDNFKSHNPWYGNAKGNDIAATALADKVADNLMREGGNLAPSEFFAEVSRQVKAELPERFSNPRRERISAVEGVGANGKPSHGKVTRSNLKPQVRDMHDAFVKGLSGKEYDEMSKAFMSNVRKNSLI